MSDESALVTTDIVNTPITWDYIKSLSKLPSIPLHYQGRPLEILAAMRYGGSLGIDPLVAVNNIDLIDGTVSMRAKLISALIHANGHIIATKEQTREICVLDCFRYHQPTNQLINVGQVTFDLEDAKLAGALGRGTYKKHIKAMLTNRAMTLAGRTHYGDCLAGIGYTPDEVNFTDEIDDIPTELELVEPPDDEEVVEEAEEVDDAEG